MHQSWQSRDLAATRARRQDAPWLRQSPRPASRAVSSDRRSSAFASSGCTRAQPLCTRASLRATPADRQATTARPAASWPSTVQSTGALRTNEASALAAAVPQSADAPDAVRQDEPRAGATIPCSRMTWSPIFNVSPSITAMPSAVAERRWLAGACAGALEGRTNSQAAVSNVAIPPTAASRTPDGGTMRAKRGDLPGGDAGRPRLKIRRLWFNDTPKSPGYVGPLCQNLALLERY